MCLNTESVHEMITVCRYKSYIQIIRVSTTAYQDRIEHEVIIKALIKHKLKKNLPVLEKKSRYLI